MEKYELKKIINQIKRYNLENVFETTNDFDKWLNELNNKQIKNFNSLEINPEEMQFPLGILLNKNLLNCNDYQARIKAMSAIKNADGWFHLLSRLCSPNFLNSKNYYSDIKMISKAPSAKYPLWIINEDTFINSPYHKEDLRLIVEAKDTKKEDGNELDWLVAEALTMVASNANSINSPYHKHDMNLIANSGSECLQMSSSYPEQSLNNLAVNAISLKDKYHLENMQILAQNPISSEFLYKLMTNPAIIKGKFYRKEIDALAKAKSLANAMAIYYYIAKPKEIRPNDYQETFQDLELSYIDTLSIRRKNIEKNNNHNYLKYLELLNQFDDKYVLFIESLLSNKVFINSPNCDYDLALLYSTKDKDIFLDLYKYMLCEKLLSSHHHIKDLDIISKTENNKLRKWLLSYALDDDINSHYHDYDMEYISKLDLENIDKETLTAIHYYLFIPKGINHPEHIERLNKLLKGETIQSDNAILNHLNYLESNIDSITIPQKGKSKILSKIRQITKKR